MLRVEGSQDVHDRVPRIAAAADEQVAADFATRAVVPARASGTSSPSIDSAGVIDAAIEDAQVMRERRDRQIDIDAGERLRRGRGTRLHHHFEPEAEAIGVELLVETGGSRFPRSRSKTPANWPGVASADELAACLQPAVLNHAVQHLGRQPGDDVCEVRHVENALEQIARVPAEHGHAALRSRAPPDRAMSPFWHGFRSR